MAEALSLQVVLKLIGSLTNPQASSTPTDAFSQDYTMTFSDGTGANQGNMIWHDQLTLIESATQNLDLSAVVGVSLISPFGTILAFTSIKGIVIKAADTNVNDVQLTRPAANSVPLFMAANDGIALGPGSVFLWTSPSAAGKPVTAATGDLLTLTNSDGGSSVVCDIWIWGTV